ncbi:MAG: protein-L-isoaspartate(D-aspartate) O-methyltransferase [Thermoguttaceae bacterium]
MSANDLQAAKEDMIFRQLQTRGIVDPRVLAAMNKVPRECFIPPEQQAQAYADRALSIDCSQTISQPYIVGLMTQALELRGAEKVLEIGTGSGYQTALLAELAREVYSIERIAQLSAKAGAMLDNLGYRNIRLQVSDGTLGWPEQAPFERIIVTAMVQSCPPALFAQLAEGGIIVIPIGNYNSQNLQAIKKIAGLPKPVFLTGCRFVPLIGAQGWPE